MTSELADSGRYIKYFVKKYWVGQKVHLVFPFDGSSSAWLSLTSFKTTLLDCIVTAVISACILRKLTRIGYFLYSHFNIEDGRQ